MSGFEVIEGELGGAPEAHTPDAESKKIRPVLKENVKVAKEKQHFSASRITCNQTAIVSYMLKELKKQQANCRDKHKEI